MTKIVIFDFDGTIADSFPWFIKRINLVAKIFHFNEVAPQDIDTMRAMSVDNIIKTLGISKFKLPFVIIYLKWLMNKESKDINVFSGVSSLFKTLKLHDIEIVILSSNSQKNVKLILGEMSFFVSGYYCGAGVTSKETHFKKVKRDFPLAQLLSVGDEPRDLAAAKKAKVDHLNVSWGYASRRAFTGDEVIETFSDLESRILRYFNRKS